MAGRAPRRINYHEKVSGPPAGEMAGVASQLLSRAGTIWTGQVTGDILPAPLHRLRAEENSGGTASCTALARGGSWLR